MTVFSKKPASKPWGARASQRKPGAACGARDADRLENGSSASSTTDSPESEDDEPVAVPLTYAQVWNKLLGWQARRDHSQAELNTKLRQFGADGEQIERALARLTEVGLQSDDRFADSLVRSQLLRGRGQRSIKQTLQQRGIAADHPALEEQTADIDWIAKAQELLQRRFGQQLSREQKDKARQVRFLQYRGYSLGQALSAINALSHSRDDDGFSLDPDFDG